MSLTTLKSIDAEIKLLEAQKKLVEKRDSEVPKAVATLAKFAKVLTATQRRQVAKIINESLEEAPAKVKATRRAGKGGNRGKVAPKYLLPSGETWTGRGLTPKVFAAWEKSAAGKAWRTANGGARFPAADGSTPTPKVVAKKPSASLRRNGTVKKSAKKAPARVKKA